MNVGAGLRLGDRYVLSDRIATGGMGEVWRGVDDVLGRPVAVKVLRGDLAADGAFRARFREEARTAGGLSHGGIAAVYDYGEAEGLAYLVMELVEGEPLSAKLARDGALGTDPTLDLVAQAARALHAAHVRGVVHRDVKPANLLITSDQRVKVTDFGIARPRDHEPLTATGQVMGTAHYLAPELARGEVASPRSDVYALGIVAYECLAGRRPFEGDNQIAVATAQLQDPPPPLPETVPLPVRQVVAAALAKRPQERPAGAQALAVALEDIYRARRHAKAVKPAAPAVPAEPSANGAAAAGTTATVAVPEPSPTSVAQPPPGSEPADAGPVPVARPQPAARREGQGPSTAVLPAEDSENNGQGRIKRWSRRWRPGRGSLPLLVLSGVVLLGILGASLGASGDGRAGAPAPSPSSSPHTGPATGSAGVPGVTASAGTAPAPSGPATTGPARNPAGRILLRPGEFLGSNVAAVRSALHDLGLRTKTRRVFSPQLPKGTVVGIEPAGLVVRGSTVTLVVTDNQRGGR